MAVGENGNAVPQIKQEEEASSGLPRGPLPRRKQPSSASTGSHITSILARLTVWYVILVALFQCPSSTGDLSDSSPRICKPYLNTRAQVQPYIQPYYDTYAGPYVEKARPYVEQAHERIVAPASSIALANYEKYAAPRLEQARVYGLLQWQKAIIPHLEQAQKSASELYEANIAPHVKKASSVAEPYYGAAKDNAINVHQRHIMPAIEMSKPHLGKAYNTTRDFTLSTGLPFAQKTWYTIVAFVDGTLWPKVKGLYGDNVKPQLVMISERIAKYQEGRKLKAAMDEAQNSIDLTSTIASSTSTGSIAASISSVVSEATKTTETSASSTTLSSEEQLANAKEQIAADLQKWQKKFAVAADKGSEDLSERVKDIIEGLVKSDVDSEGRGLAIALNKTSEVEMANVKAKINNVVATLADDASSSDVDEANQAILDAIRSAGSSIKQRANAIRQWFSKFDAEIHQRANTASDSTLEVLDGIRDLGLQEIGMRWAWMEGVTYKDWAKYHDLKKQFEDWRSEVKDAALKHESLDEAKKAAETIVEDSMNYAAGAAKELARLKDVGKWKVAARDSSDAFDTRHVPAAAASAASKISEKLSDASGSVAGTGKPTFQWVVSHASRSASDASNSISSVIAGSSQGTIESMASKASDAAADAVSSVSSAVAGSSQGSVESLASKAGQAASDAAESASSVVVGTQQGAAESIISKATQNVADAASEVSKSAESATSSLGNSAASAASSVSSVLSDASTSAMPSSVAHDTTSTVGSAASSVVSEASSSASSVASSASRKVFGGAMAQKVSSTGPIMDDIIDDDTAGTYSEKLQSIVNEAGDRYTDVTKAVSEALYGTTQGTVESMSSVAADQYSSALAAASSALYGTTPGVAESIATGASDRYSQAVSA